MKSGRTWSWILAGGALLACSGAAWANGIQRNGVGARGMALGGAEVAGPADPLGAMANNPARLSLLDAPTVSLGLTAFEPDGQFHSRQEEADLDTRAGVIPEIALGLPLGDRPIVLGFSFLVDHAQIADWTYLDLPGGVDGKTSYGRQTHYSEFIAARAAVGLGVRVSDRLSLGASLGLVYHQMGVDVPFIFQSQPTLAGWKTLLDLEAEGFGWNADFGLLYEVTEDLTFGLRYRAKTELHGKGHARGDVSAQLRSLGGLDGVEPQFRYDADVRHTLPQMLSTGLSWQFHERWRLALQVDWIDWSEAFDSLRIRLSDGSNTAINGLTGGDTLRENVPLDWDDSLVYRAGLEFTATERWTARVGYTYGRSPLPRRLVTPLNAAVVEHTVGAGLGYRRDNFQLDLGYQYSLPNPVSVGQSGFRAGEYSQSSLSTSIHSLGISATFAF